MTIQSTSSMRRGNKTMNTGVQDRIEYNATEIEEGFKAVPKNASLTEFVQTIAPDDQPYDRFEGDRPNDLLLTPELLTELWENGFINDASYIALALKLDGDEKGLDFENFAYRWRGSVDDKGKCKELKPNTVEKTIVDLKKKGGIKTKQLVLDFDLLY